MRHALILEVNMQCFGDWLRADINSSVPMLVKNGRLRRKRSDGCQFLFGSGSFQGKKNVVGRVGSRGKENNDAVGRKINAIDKNSDAQSVKIGKGQGKILR